MKKIVWRKKPGDYLGHYCEGCGEMHYIPMFGEKPWEFNNDLESPTLSPSIKQTMYRPEQIICHYFIKDGQIQYCSDSQHRLAGKTVPLTVVE